MKNTANEMRIVHRGVALPHNGESAQPGVAAKLTNMREREDALEVVGNPLPTGQLEPGDHVLLVDDDRTLVLRDGNVVWNDVVVLHTSATVISAHKVGAMLVVVTSEGNVVMRRTSTGYSTLNLESAIPQLHLAAVEQQAMTTTIPAFEFDQPYTAWQAPLAAADVQAYAKLIGNAVTTMQRNASSEGRFTGVMLARYAVRLWDDSYLWMSQPVMVGHNIISANYRSTATVKISNNQFAGTEAFTFSMNSYRLGISMLTGIAAEWRDVVKAIDVLISPQASVVDIASALDYRCIITTSSGTRRYLLEVGPKPRSASAIVQTIVNGDWRVVASTACLDGSSFKAVNTAMASEQAVPGNRCDVVTSQLMASQRVSQQECEHAMESYTLKPAGTVSMEHNGRLSQAPATFNIVNPWDIVPWLDQNLSSGSVAFTMQVSINTSEGVVTMSKSGTCPCNATTLNPVISFPDPRATHLAIALGNKVWECDLSPLEGTGMAVYINPSLASNALTLGSLPNNDNTSCSVVASGTILVSGVGNPLVTQWRAAVSGCTIRALGAACRPIYSGGFGRYPIYIFTTQGIMALPQSTSGSYGEPRLITEVVLGNRAKPVAGGDALWFVSQHNILCSIAGSTLKRWLNLNLSNSSLEMAWNDHERELWITQDDGQVVVLMPSGRSYRRDLVVKSLYSDPQHALAVTADGALLDLAIEQAAQQQVSYLSQPFELHPLMLKRVKRIVWNLFTETAPTGSVTLTLRGERGSSCHGYIISQVRATGRIAAPLARTLIAPPSRTLRLEATATIPTGTLLLPTIIQVSK